MRSMHLWSNMHDVTFIVSKVMFEFITFKLQSFQLQSLFGVVKSYNKLYSWFPSPLNITFKASYRSALVASTLIILFCRKMWKFSQKKIWMKFFLWRTIENIWNILFFTWSLHTVKLIMQQTCWSCPCTMVIILFQRKIMEMVVFYGYE